MQLHTTATILSMSIFISACATVYPQNPEDQAAYHANEAKSAIYKGDSTRAASQISLSITRPTGSAKINNLLTSYPSGRDYYIAYLKRSIADIS